MGIPRTHTRLRRFRGILFAKCWRGDIFRGLAEKRKSGKRKRKKKKRQRPTKAVRATEEEALTLLHNSLADQAMRKPWRTPIRGANAQENQKRKKRQLALSFEKIFSDRPVGTKLKGASRATPLNQYGSPARFFPSHCARENENRPKKAEANKNRCGIFE